MVYSNWQEVIDMVRRLGRPRRVVLVAAHDEHFLAAVHDAAEDGLVQPVLVGDQHQIEPLCRKLGLKVDSGDIYHEPDLHLVSGLGISLILEGAGDFLMKGAVNPSLVLNAVTSRRYGLEMGRTLSSISWLSIPHYHKMLAVTDTFVNAYPTLEQKREILVNAVKTMKIMGYSRPMVAVLAGLERIEPRLPETADAAALKAMNRNEEIDDCLVEGPITMDLAFSKEKAALKCYHSPVVGQADILLAPNLTLAICLSQALDEIGGAEIGSVIIGARVPVVMSARTTTLQEKYRSLALAAAVSAAYRP